jgi:MYXO-CTERM domain-containing protein
MSRKITFVHVLAILAFALPSAASASVISGQVTDWQIEDPLFPTTPRAFGNDTVHVTGLWTPSSNYHDFALEPPAGTPSESAWLYGSAYGTTDTDVAWAEGITDVTSIVDASTLTFQAVYEPHRFATAQGNEAGSNIGDFAVLHNFQDGYYGVLRIDDLRTVGAYPWSYCLDVTWWVQTDGTANFSSLPEPASLSLLGLGTLALRRRR